MIRFKTKIRKTGNSYVVTIPKHYITKSQELENQKTYWVSIQ